MPASSPRNRSCSRHPSRRRCRHRDPLRVEVGVHLLDRVGWRCVPRRRRIEGVVALVSQRRRPVRRGSRVAPSSLDRSTSSAAGTRGGRSAHRPGSSFSFPCVYGSRAGRAVQVAPGTALQDEPLRRDQADAVPPAPPTPNRRRRGAPARASARRATNARLADSGRLRSASTAAAATLPDGSTVRRRCC